MKYLNLTLLLSSAMLNSFFTIVCANLISASPHSGLTLILIGCTGLISIAAVVFASTAFNCWRIEFTK